MISTASIATSVVSKAGLGHLSEIASGYTYILFLITPWSNLSVSVTATKNEIQVHDGTSTVVRRGYWYMMVILYRYVVTGATVLNLRLKSSLHLNTC